MRPEAGKRYVLINGTITGPMEFVPGYPYPFMADLPKTGCESWTENGLYNTKEPGSAKNISHEYKEPETVTEATTAAATPLPADKGGRSGFDIVGKKIRVVFKEGRDLNIFDAQSFNVDGQWWRIEDGEGRFYVVDPAKVNYTETK